ncbi:MAG: 3-deoxy-D-manno-octulosonic acid transferase [Deltaproteobacteria bacterium]|nr:MAG: 3-deoxy-D-manno-octulosonic acid transferase [Deltaproteobacteria bacterium]
MIVFYNILMFVGVVLGIPLIIPSVLTSEKRRKTVLPRLGLTVFPPSLGQYRLRKPEKKPIWVHALSVGEVLSAVPLVEKLKAYFSERDIFFSVSTKTGFEIASRRLTEKVNAIIFFPYDLVFSVRHVATKVDPAVVVIVESDIWPNFLFEMKRRQVPVALVNARLSEKSFSGYRRVSFFMGPLLSSLAKICTQTNDDSRRFQYLGVPAGKIVRTGSLKFDQQRDPISKAELVKLRRSMHIPSNRSILLAGSTHKGEETILLDVFSKLKSEHGDLLLIIAPRNPDRAESVCRMFGTTGLLSVLLDDLSGLKRETRVDVIVVDTIGILGKLYALGDIAYVGGSLVDAGGQNPLEPAAMSKPVLFGPDMSDFEQISHMLVESGGAVRVQDAESLYKNVAVLLRDHERRKNMGKRTFAVFSANTGAVQKTVEVITGII